MSISETANKNHEKLFPFLRYLSKEVHDHESS